VGVVVGKGDSLAFHAIDDLTPLIRSRFFVLHPFQAVTAGAEGIEEGLSLIIGQNLSRCPSGRTCVAQAGRRQPSREAVEAASSPSRLQILLFTTVGFINSTAKPQCSASIIVAGPVLAGCVNRRGAVR